jgi:DNA-binding transcriptional MerR regulator
MPNTEIPNRPKPMRTHHLAKALGVHVNTIRQYEAQGFIAPVPRAGNGYRQYQPIHLEQARLAHMTIRWPYLGDKTRLIDLVQQAAAGDLGMAMELAYQYLAHVRMERTYAEAAIAFLERWAAGYPVEPPRRQVNIREAARRLNVTTDMLRNWERNGLIDVPRDPANGYRLYGTAEFGRLRVIRTLVQSGYSLMAVLQMLNRFDRGERENLRDALAVEPDGDETLWVIADRWHDSLIALEERAQSIIRQLSRMIEMAHAASRDEPFQD